MQSLSIHITELTKRETDASLLSVVVVATAPGGAVGTSTTHRVETVEKKKYFPSLVLVCPARNFQKLYIYRLNSVGCEIDLLPTPSKSRWKFQHPVT